MNAALLRSRPSGSGLQTIRTGFLAHISRPSILGRHAASRSFHSPRRRPISQCLALRSLRPNNRPLLHLRHESTAPTAVSRKYNVIFRVLAYFGTIFVTGGMVILGFFIYDASTYREASSAEDIPVTQLALHPRRGGPKNLPMAEELIGDKDSPDRAATIDKPRLVILGTGWGSVALLKHLRPGDYHVTVISPENYFLFTPMLPEATVGTLGLRSLIEPIRRTIRRVHGHFLKAKAEDVDFAGKLVEVSQVDSNGKPQHFYVPYDKLVVAVGCVTNPHGVKGLEHCYYLKSISDARKIKNTILENLELACMPTTSDEERRRLLSFVVCGGGPTGVEFASEVFDLLNEDLLNQFPKIIRNEVSVHVIQSRSHILNTYDEALSKYAEARFARDNVDILTNARVKEVQKDKVLFTQVENGKPVVKEIPMGFCLWSTGVSRSPFSKAISDKLDAQNNRRALETDPHLRVIGAPLGDVYAIGDCSTVQNNLADNIVSFLRGLEWKKGVDPETVELNFRDWTRLANRVRRRYPQAQGHLRRLGKLFEQYDADHSGTLNFGELHELLLQIDSKLTSLPATAQRANQQGEYLGRKLSKMAAALPGLRVNYVDYGDLDSTVYKPFQYKHLGSLAYISNAAIFDFGGLSFSGGLVAMYLWRSVYFAQSVSFRTRCMLAMDWAKRTLFGRDLMSY